MIPARDPSKAFTGETMGSIRPLAGFALLSAPCLLVDLDKCLCSFTYLGCAVPGLVQRGTNTKSVRAGREIAG